MKNVESVILNLEELLREATLANDKKITDELLADDWINMNATGTISTKEQTLALIDRFEFLSITNEEVRVRIYPGVAIVTGHSSRSLAGMGGGAPINSEVYFTRVWAKLTDHWQVVSSQATLTAEAQEKMKN